MSPRLAKKLTHAMIEGVVKGATPSETLGSIMTLATRSANVLRRKLERASKSDTPCELSALEAGAVLAILKEWSNR